MTLENKLVENYFKNTSEKIAIEDNPKLFAKIHIDNPLGGRIKGRPGCKLCKGTGYIKCKSKKHERACPECLQLYFALKENPT